MLTPFKMGVGGVIGSGRQFMSCIALDDCVAVILHALGNASLAGPVNVVGPTPITNREFTKTLGKVLGRPTIFPMPAFAARLALGEMADELLFAATKVEPKKLLESGFRFQYRGLESACGMLSGSKVRRDRWPDEAKVNSQAAGCRISKWTALQWRHVFAWSLEEAPSHPGKSMGRNPASGVPQESPDETRWEQSSLPHRRGVFPTGTGMDLRISQQTCLACDSVGPCLEAFRLKPGRMGKPNFPGPGSWSFKSTFPVEMGNVLHFEKLRGRTKLGRLFSSVRT
jgi:hypothetical protein